MSIDEVPTKYTCNISAHGAKQKTKKRKKEKEKRRKGQRPLQIFTSNESFSVNTYLLFAHSLYALSSNLNEVLALARIYFRVILIEYS